MKLYLVQHGKAVASDVDPDRPLSDEGVADVEAVAAFLAGAAVRVPEVWHSAKTRAKQTATHLAAHIAPEGRVVERPGLKPKDPVAPIREVLDSRASDLAIVGHQPFMGRLAGLLLAQDPELVPVTFQMGGAVCIERTGEGSWTLRWAVPPVLVR